MHIGLYNSQWTKYLFQAKSDASYLFVLCLHFIHKRFFQQHRSSRAAAVWAESRGGWRQSKLMWWWLCFSLGPPLHVVCFCILSNSAVVWERRLWDGSGRAVLHPNNQHASVSLWKQAEWQTHRGTRLLSCLSFPLPSHPTPRPPRHLRVETLQPCRTRLCCRRTASSHLALESKYLIVRANEWSIVYIGWLVPWYPKVGDLPSLWLNSMSADIQLIYRCH